MGVYDSNNQANHDTTECPNDGIGDGEDCPVEEYMNFLV